MLEQDRKLIRDEIERALDDEVAGRVRLAERPSGADDLASIGDAERRFDFKAVHQMETVMDGAVAPVS
ncbi:hypothetical protein ACVWXM_008057 [Bradyrhizobium sp. GM7.3]